MSRTLRARATGVSAPRRAEAEVRAAVAFLTRMPVAPTIPDLSGAAAFGLVGGLVGVTGAVVVMLVGGAAPLAAGALAIGVIALVTGALHLDGLGDTFDALAAPDRDAAEEARRDPRLGSAGVVAVGTALIADAALIAELIGTAGVVGTALACVVAAAGSRALAVAAAWLYRGRTRPGGATWFATRITPAAVAIAAGSAATVAVAASIVVPSPALLVGAAGGWLVGLLSATAIVHARGGLDGDGLGASVEVAFVAMLLATVLTG